MSRLWRMMRHFPMLRLDPRSEDEKSNVIQTLSNGQEKNTKDLRIRKEENIREENENGFREYKI